MAAWIQTTATASNPTLSWGASGQAAASQVVFKSDSGGGGGGVTPLVSKGLLLGVGI